jgi:hypothetical protein
MQVLWRYHVLHWQTPDPNNDPNKMIFLSLSVGSLNLPQSVRPLDCTFPSKWNFAWQVSTIVIVFISVITGTQFTSVQYHWNIVSYYLLPWKFPWEWLAAILWLNSIHVIIKSSQILCTQDMKDTTGFWWHCLKPFINLEWKPYLSWYMSVIWSSEFLSFS